MPDVKIKIKAMKDNDWPGCPAYVTPDNVISINWKIFNRYSINEQKAVLLHEAGHIATPRIGGASKRELIAQVWAIKQAKLFGWKRVFNELELTIFSWCNLNWNEDKGIWRRYILAGRKYLKMKREKTL